MKKYFVDKSHLDWAEEMATEMRTRELVITTFPYKREDLEVYLFTLKELEDFWMSGEGIEEIDPHYRHETFMGCLKDLIENEKSK